MGDLPISLSDLGRRAVAAADSHEATVGVVGLGYVGLPLSLAFAESGFKVLGFDSDPKKVEAIERRTSYLRHIASPRLEAVAQRQLLAATSEMTRLKEPDAIFLCVPTPLTPQREPDLQYVQGTAHSVASALRRGQLVVLESTTYPGTTEEVVRPILERSGLLVGEDFFLAYSPEREDPANPHSDLRRIPKVVGGATPACLQVACAFYRQVVGQVIEVSSTRVAEATKLLENIYRSVNIAMVNELKLILDRLGIDIWEVIGAAATKPFGFQPFYPGPGLGGHCIPIDPFYLSWKAREVELAARFIELSGEINAAMPYHVLNKIVEALNRGGKPLRGARILILGVAYKRDVDDVRESPALKMIELLSAQGAQVSYHDPFVPQLRPMRRYRFELGSVPLTDQELRESDCVLIVTDHSEVDYQRIVDQASLVVDTRNATASCRGRARNVVPA